VIIPVVVFLLLALVYLKTEPNRYLSVGRLQVTPAGQRLSGDNSDNSQMSNFLATQSEKIMSREILALALAQPLSDETAPGASTDPTGKIRDLQTFKDSDSAPLTTMKNFVEVTPGKKNDALSVAYETPFKDEAPIIVNAIVHAYMKYQTQPKQTTTLSVLTAHREQKKNIEATLTTIGDQMSAMEQQYGVLANNGQDNLAFVQLKILSGQVEAAHLETLRGKSDYEEASHLVKSDPRLLTGGQSNDPAVLSAGDESVLRADLQGLQNKIDDMKSHYLPDHPAVRSLQKKIDQAAASYAEAVRRRYERAKMAEADLRAQFDAQQKKVADVGKAAAKYARLKDEADQQRRLSDTLDTRIHGIELQQSAGAVDIDYFDEPDPLNVKKSHPSKVRALGLALVLGLVLGCGLALTRDYMDDRLHSVDEIKSFLGLPMLGAIPQMVGVDSAVAGQMVVIEPASEVAESFRSIRTALYFGAPKDRNKTLLITSPTAGNGKSTTAANLAAVMAQAGKKVLLVDADLRNPSQHIIFNLKDNRVGLSSLLSGQGTWERAIQRAPIDGLDLLPSGPKPRNPSEMLNSPMFGELLEMLAEKYDQIIIDSPPVMGVGDARIIAANSDLTLLVLRSEQSTRKLALLARDGLSGVGAHLLGVIVNDVSRRSETNFGGSYHYPQRPNKDDDTVDEDPEEPGRGGKGSSRTDLALRPKRNNGI
jgi:capsular exopolysaccharide synthesis family protein